MNKQNRRPPRSFLGKVAQFFSDLRLALAAAGSAFKELRESIQQMVLVSVAVTTALNDEVVADLFRKLMGLLTGS